VSAIDANTLRASWKIHPEYYLYHDKFFIDVKGAEFGDVNFPKESNKPKPKKLANTHKILSCCNKAVILSVSFNGSLFVLPGVFRKVCIEC
jgi:thiol:disulfide interchange protein